MSDRTVEDLIQASVELLAAGDYAPEWLRAAFLSLYRFQDSFDTQFTRYRCLDVLLEARYFFRFTAAEHPEAISWASSDEKSLYIVPPWIYVETGTSLWKRFVKYGLLAGPDARLPSKISIFEAALAACEEAERKRTVELIACWYKVLGVSFAGRRSKLLQGVAAHKLRILAQRLNVLDIPVTNYEPELHDIAELPLMQWFERGPGSSEKGLDQQMILEQIRALDTSCSAIDLWDAPVLPPSMQPCYRSTAQQDSSIIEELMQIIAGESGYYSANAAALALIKWLVKNRRSKQPDRVELGRRLISLIDEGAAIESRRPWLEDKSLVAFKWLNTATHGEDPVSLVQRLTEAYYALGSAALPLYSEYVVRILEDGEELPPMHIFALFSQKGKACSDAVQRALQLLLKRRDDYRELIAALTVIPGVRKDVRLELTHL